MDPPPSHCFGHLKSYALVIFLAVERRALEGSSGHQLNMVKYGKLSRNVTICAMGQKNGLKSAAS